MSQLQIASLFQPYTKIMANRALNREGVGLGLAVSRNIAIALGGNVKVQSKLGKGSKFTLSLPNVPAGYSLDNNLHNRRISIDLQSSYFKNKRRPIKEK